MSTAEEQAAATERLEEPYVTIRARDGFSGMTLARLELTGQDLELSVEPTGALVIDCPSWPVPF